MDHYILNDAVKNTWKCKDDMSLLNRPEQ